jgi:RimJ/RimL family protein N-acetyltransferase
VKNNATVYECNFLYLPQVGDRDGHITAINNNIELPFAVKRIFYLYDIPGGESRGAHAHKECHQFLIATSGSFEVLLDDGKTKRQVLLNRPNLGLHIPPGIWASEINFSSGSICLVLASHEYSEDDYIRDYEEFKKNRFVRGKLTSLVNVTISDAEFICELRNNPLNNVFLSSSNSVDIQKQMNWIIDNQKTADDYFIIKDRNYNSVGTISIYNKDENGAEFGRYICSNSLNAIESVYLLLKYSFDVLNLQYIYCKTVIENEKVWKQHLKFGFKFERNEFNSVLNKEIVVQSISIETFKNFDYTWLDNILVKFIK